MTRRDVPVSRRCRTVGVSGVFVGLDGIARVESPRPEAGHGPTSPPAGAPGRADRPGSGAPAGAGERATLRGEFEKTRLTGRVGPGRRRHNGTQRRPGRDAGGAAPAARGLASPIAGEAAPAARGARVARSRPGMATLRMRYAELASAAPELPRIRAIGSVEEHCLHTAGVAGSNPASPTSSAKSPCGASAPRGL